MSDENAKIITCAVRFDRKMHKALKREAEQQHTGMSTLIRQAVSDALDRWKWETKRMDDEPWRISYERR